MSTQGHPPTARLARVLAFACAAGAACALGAALGCSSSATSGAPAGGDADDGGSDAPPADAPPAAQTLDQPDLSAMPASKHEHEPSIAVAPNGRAILSWSSYAANGTIAVGYRISNDFGATWGPATLVADAADENEAANASVAAGADGSLYMAWGAESRTGGTRSKQRVYVAIAQPNDATLGMPIAVTDDALAVGVYDRPAVAVTTSGNLHVSYSLVSTDLVAWSIVDVFSSDHGATFTRTTVAGPGMRGSYRNQSRVCQAKSGGQTYLSFVDEDVGGIALVSSDDEGKTWSQTKLLASLASDAPTLAYAPTDCVAHGDDVWVLYALSDVAPTTTVSPVFTHLRLGHSHDRGATVESDVDIADPAGGKVTMNPTLVVEDDGSLDLGAYYGNAAEDAAASFRISHSADGKTFAPSTVVHQPLRLETSRAVPQWIGDYVRGFSIAGNLYFVYAHNAIAAPHISFYRAPAPAP